jgi:hypothetical protein
MTGTLYAHTDTFPATWEDLFALPQPRSMGPDHHPMRHIELIDTVINHMADIGIQTKHEDAKFSLSTDGHKMFGVIPVHAMDRPDWGPFLGIRGSTNQAYAQSGVLGNSVFVCDNMVMHGQIRFNRKNTRFIERDLPGIIDNFLKIFCDSVTKEEDRIKWMQNKELTNAQIDHLFRESIDKDIIPARKIRQFNDELASPAHAEFDPHTVWGFQNCLTEVMKGQNANRHLATGFKFDTMLHQELDCPILSEMLSGITVGDEN